MRRVVTPLAALALLLLAAPAHAVTGRAPPAALWAARPIVMVVDQNGDLCTGTALAHDLVLTAAHCVMRPGRYRVKEFQTGRSIPVATIVRHPRFNPRAYAESRATADLALVKLASPLPAVVVPAALGRMATLTVTGHPGSLQIRLVDPRTRNRVHGLGACTGDSGGPAYDGLGPLIIGVVSWTTGPGNSEGCGGLTGLTPLLRYRSWIVDTARRFGRHL
ncbi:MAG: trypsin-like serine protease [Pseudolabrys sp.]